MNKTGKWRCHIDHHLYKGEAFAIVEEGEPYNISLEIDSPYFPKVKFVEVKEKDDELDIVARIDMIPLNIKAHIDFNQTGFNGVIKIPFIGDVLLKNGTRVDD